ncbi:methyltransferase domain-containing protein [Candidatus Bathyarchaeota archaeon]|nr:MAG: methyltransferase domain-containing protein [Candidatus Bathyarchaeota archaeon]TMI60508.1 MAG: methyltransferase domain-containing protein [Candidatus Bathyarchaeota archaeon]
MLSLSIDGQTERTAVMKEPLDPADTVLQEIEAIGKRSFIPSIGPVKGKILAEVVNKTRPRRILEVGALYGYSAILMAKNSPPKTEIISVEKNPEHVRIAVENIRQANMEGRIRVIEGDGRTELGKLSGSFDLVFLDAEKTQYLAYLKAVEKNLHKGSVIVADNVGIFKDQMGDYLEYVRKKGPYKSRTLETLLEFSDSTKDAMEISEKLD